MSDKLRIGVAGLGVMGRDLLRAVVKLPNATVSALCDGAEETWAKAVSISGDDAATFTDHRAMLDAGVCDAIIVATPQQFHPVVTLDAFAAGCHVFTEKPMALSVAECARMIDASERAGKVLMVGQVLQYLQPYAHILERIRAGEFGRPVVMRTIRSMGQWGGVWRRAWRSKGAQTGGTLFEVNVHEIDLMLRIMGPATQVQAAGGQFVSGEIDHEDFVTAQLHFQNGGLGSITSSQCDFLGKNDGEIFLEKGSIYYDSLSQQLIVGQAGAEREVHPFEDLGRETENGVEREVREFVEACLGQGPVTIPGEDGLHAVEIAQACYQSLREERAVTLPLRR